jgi:hypothetical protein
MKSAPMGQQPSLWFRRIWNCTAIKAFSFIPYGDQYFSVHAAPAGYMNLLFGIFMIAMDHGICESFAYGNFNFICILSGAPDFPHQSLDESHKFINEWRDGSNAAGQESL